MPMEESQNYTLSLHDALPIWGRLKSAFDTVATAPVPQELRTAVHPPQAEVVDFGRAMRARNPRLRLAADARQCAALDRKSTRLNSSHANISYAVFCLKKKKNT